MATLDGRPLAVVLSASLTTCIVRRMLEGLTLIESIPSLREAARDFGTASGRLAANADMTSIMLGAEHCQPEHFQHAGVTLVR